MIYKPFLSLVTIVILLFFTSNLFSDYIKNYHEPIKSLKIIKSKSLGSGYVQRKPDPPNILTINLAEKAMKKIQLYGKERAFKLFTEKYKKFRKYNTYLFVLDMQGNVLAHTGNPNFVNTNLFNSKDFSGLYFVQDYITTIGQIDQIDYVDFFYYDTGQIYLIKYVHLERIDENCFLGCVAIEKH